MVDHHLHDQRLWDTDTITVSHGKSDRYPDGHTYSDSYRHRYSFSYGYSHSYPDGNSNSDSYHCTVGDTYCHRNDSAYTESVGDT
jgi:hypothetical protein